MNTIFIFYFFLFIKRIKLIINEILSYFNIIPFLILNISKSKLNFLFQEWATIFDDEVSGLICLMMRFVKWKDKYMKKQKHNDLKGMVMMLQL